MRYRRPSRPAWEMCWGTAARTTGFAWNATPRPASPSIGTSLAPSPTAMTRSSGMPCQGRGRVTRWRGHSPDLLGGDLLHQLGLAARGDHVPHHVAGHDPVRNLHLVRVHVVHAQQPLAGPHGQREAGRGPTLPPGLTPGLRGVTLCPVRVLDRPPTVTYPPNPLFPSNPGHPHPAPRGPWPLEVPRKQGKAARQDGGLAAHRPQRPDGGGRAAGQRQPPGDLLRRGGGGVGGGRAARWAPRGRRRVGKPGRPLRENQFNAIRQCSAGTAIATTVTHSNYHTKNTGYRQFCCGRAFCHTDHLPPGSTTADFAVVRGKPAIQADSGKSA